MILKFVKSWFVFRYYRVLVNLDIVSDRAFFFVAVIRFIFRFFNFIFRIVLEKGRLWIRKGFNKKIKYVRKLNFFYVKVEYLSVSKRNKF